MMKNVTCVVANLLHARRARSLPSVAAGAPLCGFFAGGNGAPLAGVVKWRVSDREAKWHIIVTAPDLTSCWPDTGERQASDTGKEGGA